MAKTYRCVICSKLIDKDLDKNKDNCEVCGVSLRTLRSDYDIEIPINWDELRLLTRWAEEKALGSDPMSVEYLAFVNVINRLSKFRPENSKPLTNTEEKLKAETNNLMAELLGYGIVCRDGKTYQRSPTIKQE